MEYAMIISAILLMSLLSAANCARILGVFPIPSVSHQVVFRALLTELNSRGHEVVVITSHPINNSSYKNYIEIEVPSLYVFWKQRYNFLQMKETGGTPIDFLIDVVDGSLQICRLVFEDPEVKRLMKENKKFTFDVVIAEWLTTPCIFAFAHHFSAPLIGISSLGLFYSGYESIGNPTHPLYFTEAFYPALKNPTLWEKLFRLSYFIWYKWFWQTSALQPQDKLARQYFGNSMPFLGVLERNVSLLFTSIQSIGKFVTPKAPALIELGQMHFKENKPLPQDLQEFLDGSVEGAIYFSLGTNVRSDTMSEEKQQLFLDVFSQLSDFRVLWKWEQDHLPGKPSNVKTSKWFPQQDVLAHPKMKAFIFQGGLQSSEEALRFQVPVIGFPFFGDQDANMEMITENGIGVKLSFAEVTREQLLNTLKKIIYDPKYKINMKKLSEIVNDQPQTSLERAVWWTEYVIRHKGARHLRVGTMDISWFEYLMLDVVAFILISFSIILWGIYLVAKVILQNIHSLKKLQMKRD